MSLKSDFPFFQYNPAVVYLDSASTTQKPNCVLQAMTKYYSTENANVDGYYLASIRTNQRIQEARETVAEFVGLAAENIIFGGGVTVTVNMLASGLKSLVHEGDYIIITEQDHHSNTLPFRELAIVAGAKILTLPVKENGELNLEWLEQNIQDKVIALVALSHISNVLGIVNDISEISQIIKNSSPTCKIILDACQSVAHIPLSNINFAVDYFFFSAHKCYGPTGVSVLCGSLENLELIQPTIFGGKMVDGVDNQSYTYRELPERLEPGTPNVAGYVGLTAAIQYLQTHLLVSQEDSLLTNLQSGLEVVDRVKILAAESRKIGLLAFTVKGVEAQDLGILLAKQNICLRTGTQCAQPLHTAMHIPGTIRVSIGIYTDELDVQAFLKALQKSLQLLH